MARILQLFDSNSYDDRIAAGLAMEDLSTHVQAHDLATSDMAKKILEKLYQLIQGKYFVKKEVLLDSYANIISLMENQSPFIKSWQLTKEFITATYLKQIDKFMNSYLEYKNKLIEFVNKILAGTHRIEAFTKELKDQYVDVASVILVHVLVGLENISANINLHETNVNSFDEAKDEEKQNLLTVSLLMEQFPLLWLVLPREEGDSYHSQFVEICKKFYSFTNFYVRKAMLTAIVRIIKDERAQKKNVLSSETFALADFVLEATAKQGEKYDTNLELLSEACLQISQVDIPGTLADRISKNSETLVQILQDRGADSLRKNVDLIRAKLQ